MMLRSPTFSAKVKSEYRLDLCHFLLFWTVEIKYASGSDVKRKCGYVG